jgi:hypothetical protein
MPAAGRWCSHPARAASRAPLLPCPRDADATPARAPELAGGVAAVQQRRVMLSRSPHHSHSPSPSPLLLAFPSRPLRPHLQRRTQLRTAHLGSPRSPTRQRRVQARQRTHLARAQQCPSRTRPPHPLLCAASLIATRLAWATPERASCAGPPQRSPEHLLAATLARRSSATAASKVSLSPPGHLHSRAAKCQRRHAHLPASCLNRIESAIKTSPQKMRREMRCEDERRSDGSLGGQCAVAFIAAARCGLRPALPS